MQNSTSHFGVHYMLGGYEADLHRFKGKAALRLLLDTLPKNIDMHPISEPVVVRGAADRAVFEANVRFPRPGESRR